MKRKIRVGAVSYLNTKPLIYGLENGRMGSEMELVMDYPSRIAEMLISDDIDLGLVPVAIIPKLKEHHIVSDYCIGAVGEVASVCLFSDVPIEKIETVLLDYQSRTSVALLKLLLKKFWKISPRLTNSESGYEEKIIGSTAGLVIGDRALDLRRKFAYIYDLSTAWNEMTGLPFVFAAWISNKPLPQDFVTAFNEANRIGLDQIGEVIANHPSVLFDLREYYTRYISYELDAAKRQGLNLFLTEISTGI